MCGAVVALTVTYGCGSDRRAGGGDAGAEDAGRMDTGAPDAGGSDAGPPSCAEQAPLDVDLEIDPGGPDTQIHAAAAFDGEGIWVVYNRPEPGDTGNFDVWAQRLGCDGEPLLPSPLRVNTTTPHNDVDPDLAVSDGRVLFAWSSDSGELPDNLSLHFRVFEVDGTAVMEEDAELVTTWDGADATGNHWEASVTGRPGGGFVVAGSRAIPDATTFQVFAPPLTAEGALDGDTWYPVLEPDVSQTAPSVTYRDDTPWLAWTREDDTTQQVMLAELPAAGDATAAPGLESLDSSASADLDRAWLALSDTTDGGPVNIHLVGDVEHSIGAAFEPEHSPRVSADGPAVAWFRNESGIRNELLVARAGGPERTVANEVPPYQPAFTSVGEGVYFVAWSEGTSPDFRAVGRFVSPSAI